MRSRPVSIWSPWPPERSGIADYSAALVSELRQHLELTAVAREARMDRIVAPDGVALVSDSQFWSRVDSPTNINIYQMGNHGYFHSWMHPAMLARPGIMVLHDASLYDFYATLCGPGSLAFEREISLDLGGGPAPVPTNLGAGSAEVDRLALPLTRRLVDASLATVVHSVWAAERLRQRHPEAAVYVIDQPTWLLGPASASESARPGLDSSRPFTFGVFGGLSRPKRVDWVLRAFAKVHSQMAATRLQITGRSDDVELIDELRRLVVQLGLESHVAWRLDAHNDGFDSDLLAVDVVVNLRWPSVGETSATLLRAFGAARPVITTDLPQYRGFDDLYCWQIRAPGAGTTSLPELEERMLWAAKHPTDCVQAGRLARQHVELRVSWPKAAERYAEVVQDCLRLASR